MEPEVPDVTEMSGAPEKDGKPGRVAVITPAAANL